MSYSFEIKNRYGDTVLSGGLSARTYEQAQAEAYQYFSQHIKHHANDTMIDGSPMGYYVIVVRG